MELLQLTKYKLTRKGLEMKDYRKTIEFVDANHNLFEIEANITTRNGFREFTASGNWGESCGQCLDSINPLNQHQKKFIDLWNKYHLKNIESINDFEDMLDSLLLDIEDAEEERKGEPLTVPDNNNTEEEHEQFYKMIEDKTGFGSTRDLELTAAFIEMFELSENDLEDIEINGTYCNVQGIDYLAGDDEEMDEAWDEELESFIDECLEIPEHLEYYFDREAWKSNARIDGRAHALSRYDGSEESALINDTWYYAYRQ